MLLSKENHPGWMHFGHRYLRASQFGQLCESVGLRFCSENELETYERERWIWPAARVVMPDRYAHAFWLATFSSQDQFEIDDDLVLFDKLNSELRFTSGMPKDPAADDLRHPIDRSWGTVGGLVKPRDADYTSWDAYFVELDVLEAHLRRPTAEHYYHYWQIYELFLVRREHAGMYRDNVIYQWPPEVVPTNPAILWGFLDAVSYFQHLYLAHRLFLTVPLPRDPDGWSYLPATEQTALDEATLRYAADATTRYSLAQDDLFAGMRYLVYLHYNLESSERVHLADALKEDLWRAMQFVGSSCAMSNEEISTHIGRVDGMIGDYLELVFPNKRRRTRAKAERVLTSLSTAYDANAALLAKGTADVTELLNYLESADLALFEYVLVELNDAHLATHSWQTSEAFLRLKSLASLPESLARTLIQNNADAATHQALAAAPRAGLSRILQILLGVLQQSGLDALTEYTSLKAYWGADSPPDFTRNLSYLLTLPTTSEEIYLGVTLSVSTLVRNFTSHNLVEDPLLLRGQYVPCANAIASAIFAIWRIAKLSGWI